MLDRSPSAMMLLGTSWHLNRMHLDAVLIWWYVGSSSRHSTSTSIAILRWRRGGGGPCHRRLRRRRQGGRRAPRRCSMPRRRPAEVHGSVPFVPPSHLGRLLDRTKPRDEAPIGVVVDAGPARPNQESEQGMCCLGCRARWRALARTFGAGSRRPTPKTPK